MNETPINTHKDSMPTGLGTEVATLEAAPPTGDQGKRKRRAGRSHVQRGAFGKCKIIPNYLKPFNDNIEPQFLHAHARRRIAALKLQGRLADEAQGQAAENRCVSLPQPECVVAPSAGSNHQTVKVRIASGVRHLLSR